MQKPITHLLYLHGFRSSPLSMKARKTAAWVHQHRPDIEWWCPQLPPSPRAAMEMINERFDSWPMQNSSVIGSSLGGFYATALAQRTGCRAVLLNPAVYPARDLTKYVGEITAWHSDERFYFDEKFIDELHELTPAVLTHPARFFAVIAKGDEVLDWREMVARYVDCSTKLLEGGDHALSDFDDHLPDMTSFLGLG